MTDPVPVLQTALAAEHAVIWGYAVVGALVSTDLRIDVTQDDTSHRARRDATVTLIRRYGGDPAAPAASYQLPFQVTDQATALRLAVQLEDGAAAAWRYVVASTDLIPVRRSAVLALTEAAVRGTRWRRLVSPTDPTAAFPGQPG